MTRIRVPLVLIGTCAGVALAGATTSNADSITPAQASYLEGCGGCHGIHGSSARDEVPELRDAVGWFLCTQRGREYIVRLPNVAFANADDELLAQLMNFVVFDLGGPSVPSNATPYSAQEVGVLRKQALKNMPLAQMRAEILKEAIDQCRATRGSN
ncbi:MAG: hypothetical protein ABW110_12140 [Steroidobacteraceae bacterium]